jgi:hypothetical protein
MRDSHRKRAHLSGLLPLPEVFGHVGHALPPVENFYSDIPCQLLPHLKKYDPALYAISTILLGKIHRVSCGFGCLL